MRSTAPFEKGRTECRALKLRPQPHVQNEKYMSLSHYRSSQAQAFPAQWFTAYSVLSPVSGLIATVTRAPSARRLDASIGASGPHAFAVRDWPRSSCAAIRVHRIPSRVRDDASAPRCEPGSRKISTTSEKAKEKYFLRGPPGQLGLIPFTKFVQAPAI